MNDLVRKLLPRLAVLAYRHRHSLLRGVQRGARGVQRGAIETKKFIDGAEVRVAARRRVVASYLEETAFRELSPEEALAKFINAGALTLNWGHVHRAVEEICRARPSDPLKALLRDWKAEDTIEFLTDLRIEEGRVVNYLETLCRLRMR